MNGDGREQDAVFRIPGGWRIRVDRSLLGEPLLSSIGEFAVSGDVPGGWARMESSRNTRVWRFRHDDRGYLLKMYLERGPFDNLKAVLNGTRAERAWAGGRMLTGRGFLTPRVCLVGEKRALGFPTENFLVTEWVEDAIPLLAYVRESFSLPMSSGELERKRRFVRALGGTIGRLHGRGIFHGDLRPGNILVTEEGEGPRFHLIDNERNRHFPGGIPDRLRLKNLVQINMIVYPQVTFADRLRFFRAYLGENPRLAPSAKEWIRKVFLRSRQRLRKTFPGVWGERP